MNTELDCPDCGRTFFNEGLVLRGNVRKCEDCWAKDKPTTTMNWIDAYEERIALGNEGVQYILEDLAKEATAQGAQEALAKVEEWVKESVYGHINIYEIQYLLQQLKDNKTVCEK